MSLANAVFVDEMTIDNNDKLEQKIDALVDEVQRLREDLGAQERPASKDAISSEHTA